MSDVTPMVAMPFEYAVLRFVPRVERGEYINIGVVLICRAQRFLQARMTNDLERARNFAPELTNDQWSAILDAIELIPRICAGDRAAGPIARLSFGERWHWVVAPVSTVIQSGPVHTGICQHPELLLDRLFEEQVAST